jgi:hypothetical protein
LTQVGEHKVLPAIDSDGPDTAKVLKSWNYAAGYFFALVAYCANLEYSNNPCTVLELFLDFTGWAGLLPLHKNPLKERGTVILAYHSFYKAIRIIWKLFDVDVKEAPHRSNHLFKFGCARNLNAVLFKPVFRKPSFIKEFLLAVRDNALPQSLAFPMPLPLEIRDQAWGPPVPLITNRARAIVGLPFCHRQHNLDLKRESEINEHNINAFGRGHQISMILPDCTLTVPRVTKTWKTTCLITCSKCGFKTTLSRLYFIMKQPCIL